MGADDKVENSVDENVGKAKEKYGEATGDEDKRAEGQADQSKAGLKQAGEKIKDAFK